MIAKRGMIRLALGVAALFLTASVAGAQAGVGGEARAETGRSPAIIPPPEPRRFDSFGDIPSNDIKARLDGYAGELQGDPMASGLIVSYVGRDCRTTSVRANENLMRTYLVNTRGLDASRIAVLDGGRRRRVTYELWVIPRNDARPRPSPTMRPCPPPRPARPRRR